MSEERRRVLDLLAQGKITVDEAEKLLAAIAGASAAANATPTNDEQTAKPRYLRIAVHKRGTDRHAEKDVAIRVPVSIVRSGMRLAAIIPGLAGQHVSSRLRDRGIDLDLEKIDPAMIDALLRDFGELNIDVDSGRAQVRITCE
jgi:hypothetical protein